MFNTSTLISLGLTALLCGIIMFYCKRKFVEYEQKLNVMSDLISNIITQLNQIPSSVYDNSQFMSSQADMEVNPNAAAAAMAMDMNMNMMNMNVNMDVVEDDSDDEDEDYENNNENNNEVNNNEDKRIIVNLGNNYQNENENQNQNENQNENQNQNENISHNIGDLEALEQDSWDSEEEEDDEDESNKINIQEHDLNVNIETVSIGDRNSLNGSHSQSHIEEGEEGEEGKKAKKIANEVSEEVAKKVVDELLGEVKTINTNIPIEVDYSKMQVSMLKKLVSERKLAQGVSKMKKQELVDILMSKGE